MQEDDLDANGQHEEVEEEQATDGAQEHQHTPQPASTSNPTITLQPPTPSTVTRPTVRFATGSPPQRSGTPATPELNKALPSIPGRHTAGTSSSETTPTQAQHATAQEPSRSIGDNLPDPFVEHGNDPNTETGQTTVDHQSSTGGAPGGPNITSPPGTTEQQPSQSQSVFDWTSTLNSAAPPGPSRGRGKVIIRIEVKWFRILTAA